MTVINKVRKVHQISRHVFDGGCFSRVCGLLWVCTGNRTTS